MWIYQDAWHQVERLPLTRELDFAKQKTEGEITKLPQIRYLSFRHAIACHLPRQRKALALAKFYLPGKFQFVFLERGKPLKNIL